MKIELIRNAEQLLSRLEIKNLLPDSQHESEAHVAAQALALPLWQELYGPGATSPDPQVELIATKIFWLGQSDSSFGTRYGKIFDFSKSNSDFLGFSARFRESHSPLVSQLKEFVESHQRVRVAFYQQHVDEDSFAKSLLGHHSFDALPTRKEWEGWKEGRLRGEAPRRVLRVSQKNDRATAFATASGFFEITQPHQARYDFAGVHGRIDNTVEERQTHGHEEGDAPFVEGSWEFLAYTTIRELLKANDIATS